MTFDEAKAILAEDIKDNGIILRNALQYAAWSVNEGMHLEGDFPLELLTAIVVYATEMSRRHAFAAVGSVPDYWRYRQGLHGSRA